MKLEFLVAVEKIRKETEVAKAKYQQFNHQTLPKPVEQQRQQALKPWTQLDPQHRVIPPLPHYTEKLPVVPSSSKDIPTTAEKNASLVSTGEIM